MDVKGKKYNLSYYKERKDCENYCYAYCFNAINEGILDGKMLATHLEERNTPKSLLWLACCYWFGFGVTGNLDTCAKYLKLSYQRGNLEAGVKLATLYTNMLKTDENVIQAITILEEGVKQDNALALLSLGILYYAGNCVPENKQEAIKYMERSAEQGLAAGQYELGVRYLMQHQIDKALHCLHLSADNGHTHAFGKIGRIYGMSKYNRVDIEKAIQYYSQDNSIATHDNLGFIYVEHFKDYKKAIFHYQKSIQMFNNLYSWKRARYINWNIQSVGNAVHFCETELVKSYVKSLEEKTLDKTEWVYACELLLKHNKDLTQISILLKPSYTECLDRMDRDTRSIVISYLIKN